MHFIKKNIKTNKVSIKNMLLDSMTEPFIFSTFFICEIILTPYYATMEIYERASFRMYEFKKN
jgi:hypothetical protein